MQRTVVVTGASGFIGKALLLKLESSGAAVLPVSRSPGGAWCQVADYRDAPSADVLVHLAEANERSKVNEAGAAAYEGAIGTMEILLGKGYKRVIYVSSAVLYGDAESRPHGPDDQVHLVDCYTKTKWQCERRVLAGIGHAVARLANIYGPSMSPRNVVSTVLQQIPGVGDLSVWDGSPVRDFLWIEDAASALVQLALGDVTGIVNLGSGNGCSIGTLARTALELCGEGYRQVRSTNPAPRASQLVLDISATTRALNWRPATRLEEGIGRLITNRLSN